MLLLQKVIELDNIRIQGFQQKKLFQSLSWLKKKTIPFLQQLPHFAPSFSPYIPLHCCSSNCFLPIYFLSFSKFQSFHYTLLKWWYVERTWKCWKTQIQVSLHFTFPSMGVFKLRCIKKCDTCNFITHYNKKRFKLLINYRVIHVMKYQGIRIHTNDQLLMRFCIITCHKIIFNESFLSQRTNIIAKKGFHIKTSFLQTYMIFLMKLNKSILFIMVVLQESFVGSSSPKIHCHGATSSSYDWQRAWIFMSSVQKFTKCQQWQCNLSNITSDFHKHS